MNPAEPVPNNEGDEQDTFDVSGRRPLTLLRLSRLCRKELREILRDRRTIFTLILMPLLAYPLLSVAFQRLLVTSSHNLSGTDCVIGVESRSSLDKLQLYLSVGNSMMKEADAEQPASEADDPIASLIDLGSDRNLELKVVVVPQLESALREGLIDLGVKVTEVRQRPLLRALGRPMEVEFLVKENSAVSESGMKFMQKRLQLINDSFLRRLLTQSGAGSRLPVEIAQTSVSSPSSANTLTTFVPLILILMTITGAVYPAIDLTAGERERDTLETLMAAPVPRFGLLFAKYVAVVTVAMLTATANLVAMTVTLLATGMEKVVFGPSGPTIALFDQVFVLLMLFAAFFSAILLAATSFARSFKEAQAYLIPLMLVTLAPGIMSLMPNLEFTGYLAVTPLVNIVLLARDLLEGDVDLSLATASVLSTLFYAAAALALAARIFGTDAVLYGSQATWTDLLRRPERSTAAPSVPGTVFCLAVIYPFYFLLANSLQRLPDLTMTMRLVLSAVVTVALFVLLPILVSVVQRTRFLSTFQLHRFGVWGTLGAMVLGLSLWPYAHEVFMLNQLLGLNSLDLERIEGVQALLESWRMVSPIIILLTLAIAPAVCEEFFFRGYLLGAFRRAMPPHVSILVSSLLFGVFHVITTSTLATERLLPSTFLGLVLGWVCLRTKSLFPGIVLHMFHNGLLLMIAYYRDELAARGWGVSEQSHMPATWLAVAGLGVAIGIVFVLKEGGGRKRKVKEVTGGNGR